MLIIRNWLISTLDNIDADIYRLLQDMKLKQNFAHLQKINQNLIM